MKENKIIFDKSKLIKNMAIIISIISVYGKMQSFGWYTITLLPFFIAQLYLFMSVGINMSYVSNKNKIDYMLYFFLCITILICFYTFVDVGDKGPDLQTIHFIKDNALKVIWRCSSIMNIILIVLLKIKWRKNKEKLSIKNWAVIFIGIIIALNYIFNVYT